MTRSHDQATPVRTAILGFGLSGRFFHAPFLADNPDYTVSAVVTRNAERRALAEKEYPGVQLLDSPDDVWERADDFDLVVIGTPTSTHERYAAEALDAGLHVVVDKPFALTSAGGRALIARAEEVGKILTVFQNRRWDGDFLTVRGLVEAGELGDVRRFESRFERWERERPESWRTLDTRDIGGGVVYDLGTHLVDQAIQLFGPVREVYAEADHRGQVFRADDDAFLALHHDSGARSHLWMSTVAPGPAPRFHISGSRAGYTSWGLDGQEESLIAGRRPGDPGFGVTPETRWGSLTSDAEVRTVPTEDGDYGAFYRGLAPALRGEAPVPVDPSAAVEVLTVLERAFAFCDGAD